MADLTRERLLEMIGRAETNLAHTCTIDEMDVSAAVKRLEEEIAAYDLALVGLAVQRDGWVLVPKEPTQEMVEAGRPRPKNWDASPVSRKVRETADRLRRNDWAEMLSAVPPLTALPEPKA